MPLTARWVVIACSVAVVSGFAGRSVPAVPPTVVALINASAPLHDVMSAQFCGGALVSSMVVLSARHCIAARAPSHVDVLVGADNLCVGAPVVGERRRVSRFVSAPAPSDLVALILAEPVRAMPTDRGNWSEHASGIAYGWGRDGLAGVAPCRLQSVRLTGSSGCALALARFGVPLGRDEYCALPARGEARNTCVGDSGGPVYDRGELVGIVSRGIGCEVDSPGLYVDVASERRWIANVR